MKLLTGKNAREGIATANEGTAANIRGRGTLVRNFTLVAPAAVAEFGRCGLPMRSLLATPILFVATMAFAGAPDALEGGTSPTKLHDVVLDTTPETPVLLVRELPGHRIVGRLEWPGDPTGGDTQPLRTHAKVLWQPTGKAVAINTDERFYSYTSVLALQPKSSKFVQVQFPDYKALTGFPAPNPDHLRPRAFACSERWTPKGNLVYSIGYAPDASYDGPDPLSHRITLSVTPTGMKVLRREANPEDR